MTRNAVFSFSKGVITNNYWDCVTETIRSNSSRNLLVTSQGSISYETASRVSDSICHFFKKTLGLSQAGIGLSIQDPCKLVPAMMGVLKSNNYSVILDMNYPEITLNSMVIDSRIDLIVTDNNHLDFVSTKIKKEVRIINIDDLINLEKVPEQDFHYALDDIAQVIFTSGSTGTPKGVVFTYRTFTHSVYTQLKTLEYSPDDRLLQLSSFSFSGFLASVFTALITGFTIFYHDIKNEGFSGLPIWIQKNKISILTTSPSTFRGLTETIRDDDVFPSIRMCKLSGEKREKRDLVALKKYCPNITSVRLGYGGTEFHTAASSLIPIDELLELEVLPSGLPLDEIKIFIWDESGNVLPPGEEGEIVIYGDSLAAGYINNPDLTDQKFIRDPKNPPWQYFKTGDLGKILEDGQLLHLGRLDNMVKIRGVRVELEGIEKQVLSYPGVIQVVSRVFENTKAIKKVVVYFVAEEGIEIPLSDLRKHLLETLTIHQIPNYLLQLPGFPTTPSGKVAYSELPLPSITRPSLKNSYQKPADETEKRIVAIWEDQIGITGVGVTDDFFELGGDSLIGVLIFAALEEEFAKKLPVSILLEASNIQALARIISGTAPNKLTKRILTIREEGSKPPLFFVPGLGGYPTRIRHLASKIGVETPVYALQEFFDNQGGNSPRTIESIARIFIKEIKTVRPSGPVVLIGESMGGKIVYEMAQQLVNGGEPQPLLFLLDTNNTGISLIDEFHNRRDFPYFKTLIKKHTTIIIKSDRRGRKDYIKFYSETIYEKLRRFIKRRLSRTKIKSSITTPDAIRKNEIMNHKASNAYTTKPYAGQVILVKTKRGLFTESPANGWDRFEIGKLIVEELDCYHGSILFEPAVSQLAKIIENHMIRFVDTKDSFVNENRQAH